MFFLPKYLDSTVALVQCMLLSFTYVCSFYIRPTNANRNDPMTVRHRLMAVSVMVFLSPLYTYLCINHPMYTKWTLLEIVGFRKAGFLMAATVPLILTVILFLGPIVIQSNSGQWDLYTEPRYWLANVKSLLWLRDNIIAPFSEELTFTTCMLPILVQHFQPQTAVYISPIFFGIAHLHHIFGRLRSGLSIRIAIIMSVFQISYTTLFGAYSAFLFLRTGHFIAPFLAHAFCNLMGFPDFSEALRYREPKKTITFLLCIVGLLTWCLLLAPLTNPSLYKNTLYWRNEKFDL